MTPVKVCPRCATEKPITAFYRSKHRESYGVKTHCKKCCADTARNWYHSNKDRHRAGVAARKAKDPDKYRDIQYKYTYGISLVEYNKMAAAQGNVCAICNKPELEKIGKLSVDHCHSTGQVRGLLCQKCNMGIGMFGDDPDKLRAAIVYLQPPSPHPMWTVREDGVVLMNGKFTGVN